MANTQVSYDGALVYYNNDSTTSPFLVTESNTEIYLNSNISKMFNNCRNLAMSLDNIGLNHQYVTNMSWAYQSCSNLTGSPVCGPNVTNMASTYDSCYNLTGSPVCGPNVTNMARTYLTCYNLTGSPVCGPNVRCMARAYIRCNNLTGSPVCGPNVTDMAYAYYGCTNLTGSPVAYNNVYSGNTYDDTGMARAYYGCVNLTGNLYLRNPNAIIYYHSDWREKGYHGPFYEMLGGRGSNPLRINIFVVENSNTNNVLYNSTRYYDDSNIKNTKHHTSIVGMNNITWTQNTSNKCYYNTAYNIYCYYTL